MARYDSSDLTFDVPREWQDKTIVAFAAPIGPLDKAAANVVMTREEAGPHVKIGEYADRHLGELAKKLDAFELLERKEGNLGGVPSIELKFQWKGGGGAVEQRLAFLRGKRRIYSFTTTSPLARAAELSSTFDRVLSSIRVAESDR